MQLHSSGRLDVQFTRSCTAPTHSSAYSACISAAHRARNPCLQNTCASKAGHLAAHLEKPVLCWPEVVSSPCRECVALQALELAREGKGPERGSVTVSGPSVHSDWRFLYTSQAVAENTSCAMLPHEHNGKGTFSCTEVREPGAGSYCSLHWSLVSSIVPHARQKKYCLSNASEHLGT